MWSEATERTQHTDEAERQRPEIKDKLKQIQHKGGRVIPQWLSKAHRKLITYSIYIIIFTLPSQCSVVEGSLRLSSVGWTSFTGWPALWPSFRILSRWCTRLDFLDNLIHNLVFCYSDKNVLHIDFDENAILFHFKAIWNFGVHKALVPARHYIAILIESTPHCTNNTTEYSKVMTLLINTSHSSTVVSSWHRPTCHWSVDCVRIFLCRRAGLSYRWSQLADIHYSFTGLAAWNTPKLPFTPESRSTRHFGPSQSAATHRLLVPLDDHDRINPAWYPTPFSAQKVPQVA